MHRPTASLAFLASSVLRLGAFLLAMVLLAVPLAAAGSAFVVDSTADEIDASPGDGVCASISGGCTLRAAIMETNALPGPDEIIVPEGRYRLAIPGSNEDAGALGDLDVLDEVSIVGAGSGNTVVDAGGIDRVLDIHSLAALPTLGTVRIRDLTLENGAAPPAGPFPPLFDVTAGLRALAASVELTRVAISRNAGGGLFVSGLGYGGGLAISVGFELLDSTIEANAGTGVVLRDVTGSLLDSRISGNEGWGIDHQGGQITRSQMSYSNSVLEGNAKGGFKLLDNSDNTYVGMRITDNGGPGISYDCVDCLVHELRDSEISRNHAQEGAGILLGGQAGMRVVNSTISENSALRGGGIAMDVNSIFTRLVLEFSTVSANEAQVGGGLAAGDAGSSDVSLLASVLAGNIAPVGPDCAVDGFGTGLIYTGGSLGYSALGTVGLGAGRCGITVGPGDQRDIADPGLLPLADNGGPTLTQSIRRGSVLLDRVPIGSCSESVDQRGITRPQGPACDIGAFERVPPRPGPTCGIGPELVLLTPLLMLAHGRRRRRDRR